MTAAARARSRVAALALTLVVLIALPQSGDTSVAGGGPVSALPGGVPRFPMPPDDAPRCAGCSVVFVSIDTLRSDHLQPYGYDRPTSPSLQRFARDAVVYRAAVSHAPSTLPSHASMLTSLLPSQHGALFARSLPLPETAITLPEVLSVSGFDTAYFGGFGQMAPEWGLDQGFDHYVYAQAEGGKVPLLQGVQRGSNWIDGVGYRQFFLFLHTYETHTPYHPHPGDLKTFVRAPYRGRLGDDVPMAIFHRINDGDLRLDADDMRHLVDLYDAHIRSADRAFGQLLSFLQDAGVYDETMIVVTSDHGEEFGERDRFAWHSHHLHRELLDVPLLIKYPRSAFAGHVEDRLVRLIDVMPTILDVLELETIAPMQGVSLLDVMRGRLPALHAVSERDVRSGELPAVIRNRRWKLYGDKLFDLMADPLETVDVAADNPVVVAGLLRALAAARAGPGLEGSGPVTPDAATLEQLRALGYIR